MSVSIGEALRRASQKLDQAGVAEARREAGSLLSHVIARDRTFLISHAEDRLSESELEHFENAIARRATGEPAQYITGTQDFFGRAFRVTPDVLIPRPETELLVEAALAVMNAEAIVCDVGTGSGCIAITLLCERSDARAVALDISEAALDVARQNARELSVAGDHPGADDHSVAGDHPGTGEHSVAREHPIEERIDFVLSDCFSALNESVSQFDLIISNPPYVSASMLPGLQREVRDHEPLVALSPGEDGLSVIRRLLNDSPRFLRTGGHLLMEIGFDQGEKVQQLIDPNIWSLKEIRPDLQCIPRIVVLQKN